MYKENNPNLVFIDIVMPIKDGRYGIFKGRLSRFVEFRDSKNEKVLKDYFIIWRNGFNSCRMM